MFLAFRPIKRTPDEIRMGQALWFNPVDDCDGISATANITGFTPVRAIGRRLAWDRVVVNQAAAVCNVRQEVCVVPFSPKLLLVPATKGRGDSGFLIRDLIASCRSAGVRSLHFTHWGFIQGKLPAKEVASIMSYLISNVSTLPLQNLVIDIDARVESDFFKLLISGELIGRQTSEASEISN